MQGVRIFPPLLGEKQFLARPVLSTDEEKKDGDKKNSFGTTTSYQFLHQNDKRILLVSVLSGWNTNETKTRFQWVDETSLQQGQPTTQEGHQTNIARMSP